MLKVKFVAESNISLEVTGNSLKECLQVQRDEKFKSFQPLAFITQSEALFYYDENIINYFVSSEEMSLQELVENSGCKALYRNKVEIITPERFSIDAGCLWKEINNMLVLVNDETFIEHKIDNDLFDKII